MPAGAGSRPAVTKPVSVLLTSSYDVLGVWAVWSVEQLSRLVFFSPGDTGETRGA